MVGEYQNSGFRDQIKRSDHETRTTHFTGKANMVMTQRNTRVFDRYPNPHMVRWVDQSSVYVLRTRDDVGMDILMSWCESNAGEQRAHHPMSEAEQGWMDFFEGDWAVEIDEADPDYWSFWFANKSVRVLFNMVWGQ
jgi:hypothetical protein